MPSIEPIADRLAAQLQRNARDPAREQRWIQGIAGIPGSGKSTFAAELLKRLPNEAAIVAMDGFHHSNQTLATMGRRDHKGAPDTFDVEAYLQVLQRLRDGAGVGEAAVRVPIYDRERHEPVPGPVIEPSVRIIITEGNYLLLDQPPWWALSDVLDGCWFVDTPIAQAKQWIIDRHARGGREPQDAEQHYERTDLPNARLVIDCRREADEVITLPTT